MMVNSFESLNLLFIDLTFSFFQIFQKLQKLQKIQHYYATFQKVKVKGLKKFVVVCLSTEPALVKVLGILELKIIPLLVKTKTKTL